ncbi:MAG TPA: hypothetical protein VMV10_14465 [Pirellulales bacterium]|nr:hypothetical protein [Pirellulales bacterium]
MVHKFGWLALFLPLGLGLVAGEPLAPAAPKARVSGSRKLHKTAKPPKFEQQELDVFFADAREKLGPGQPGGQVVAAATSVAPQPGDALPQASGGFAWSKLISASTLEDAVKAQAAPLAEQTKTPSQFNGGGNLEARNHFTVLALLYSIIADYDADVRWKKDAPSLRSMFGRAAANCKTTGANSFRVAQARTGDLAELIRGGKIEFQKDESDFKWAEVVNRPPLMARMGKEGYSAKLKTMTSDKGEFSKNRDDLLKEAQLIAAIGHVMQDASYEFADDESYLGFAKELETQAQEIVEGVKTDDLPRAQTAAGLINKACSACHEGYRSG